MSSFKRIKVAHEDMRSSKRVKVAHEADKNESSSSSCNDMKHIQDLPTDVFQHCLEFVGKGNFAFVAPVSKHFYWNYINLGVEMKNNVIDVDVILQQGKNKKTTAKGVATGLLRLATECFLKAPKSFQVEVCCQAAVNGRLDILKCAVAFGIDMKMLYFTRMSWRQLEETIVNGHLDVIQFLHDQGVDLNCDHFMWEIGQRGKASCLHWMASKGILSNKFGDNVFNYLVQNGEIDILKESYKDSAQYIDKYTFEACTRGGNVEVMNWLLQQKDCEWDLSLFTEAARGGSIPMMELCLQNGCHAHESICSSAMENWNQEAALKGLIWLRENNVPWDERVCENAARYGNLKALKWARENGCTWDEETFYDAVRFGNVDILDYCFQHNCPMAHDIDYHVNFDSVAYFDDTLTPTEIFSPTELKEKSLKLYKWLHQHAIPWNEDSSLEAAREGHWKTLMWAIDNGCPCHEDILGYVIGKSNIPILEYYLQHLASTNDTAYVFVMNKMNEAHDVTDKDMITMLQKIHDYGIPWSRDIVPCAERLGRSNVANWLRCVGCPQ